MFSLTFITRLTDGLHWKQSDSKFLPALERVQYLFQCASGNKTFRDGSCGCPHLKVLLTRGGSRDMF